MKRKKNLERAIVLGLILSTGVYGSAWAESITDSETRHPSNADIMIDNDNETQGAIQLENKNNVEINLTTDEGYSITLDSAGSGIRTQSSSNGGNITLTSGKDNLINFSAAGNGIDADSNLTITLNATGNNTIVSNETSSTGGDGVNIGANQSGKILFNAGVSNIITVSSDGIYTAEGSTANSKYIANSGNNEITAGNNGIDHRGNGNVILTAKKGSNIIKTTSGDGIRTDGGRGNVNLTAKENEIIAGDNGVQSGNTGKVSIKATNGNNIIVGAVNGIEVTSGTVDVIADNGNNTIGQYIDENNTTYTSNTGINVTEGIVNVTSKNNFIMANSTGISITGENSYLTLNAENNYIGVLNEDGGDVTGIEVIDKGNFNLSKEDGFSTESVTIETTTNVGNATGIYLKSANLVTEPAIGKLTINATSNDGAAKGISLEGNSKFDIDVNKIVINASGNSNNNIGVYGIEAKTGTDVDITAQNGIEINATNFNAINHGNLNSLVGINATTSNVNLTTNNGDIVINKIERNEDGTIKNIEDINYHSKGIVSNMGGEVTLTAERNNEINGITGVSISGSNTVPDDDGSYVVIPSSVKLNAGYINEITATVDGISVYGTATDENNSFIELNGKVNNIFVNAINGSTDLAHGIVAQYGSKVNIGNGENNPAEQTNIIVTNPVEGAVTTYGIDLLKSTANVNSDSINLVVDDKLPSTNVRGITADNSELNFNSDTTQILVNSDSLYAYGIYSQNDSNMNFNAQNSNTLQSGAYGILSYDSDINFEAIEGNNLISAKSYGIYTMTWDKLYDTNTVTMTGKNNIITATAGTSIYSNGETTTVDLDANTDNRLYAGDVTYHDADNGGGLYGSQKAINALSGSTVTLDAGNANAISGAVYASGTDTTVDLTSTGQNTYSTNNDIRSAAVIANAGGLSDTVISALYAEKGANISVSGERNVIRTYAAYDEPEELERVVWAYDTADITIDGATIIGTDTYEKRSNSNDIAIAAGTATNLTKEEVNAPVADRATVTLTYDNFTTNDGKQALSSITGDILSAYEGLVNISAKSGSNAGINITGNLLSGNNGILNVDLGNGGTLTGRVDDYGDAGVVNNSGHGTNAAEGQDTFFDPAFSSDIFKGGEVNLTMGDNSRWNVTGQSWITRIDTENSSQAIIDLVGSNTDRNTTAHALTVYEMNGDAIFNMSLDADRDVSDMLYIKNADGSYRVNIVDAVTTADMYANGFDGLRFATVGAGSNASFTAFTYDQGAMNVEYEVGTDSYENNSENSAYNGENMTQHKPGNSLVDGFFGSDGEPGSTTEQQIATANIMLLDETAETENGETVNNSGLEETTNFKLIARKSEELSNAGKTILNMSRANYSNAIYMDRLNKRLGEARYINGEEEDGMWVRIRHDRIGKTDAYRSQNTMYELGYDKKQDCDNGERRVGFAIDYMHGDTGYNDIAGKGEIDRYGLWLYDTWLGDKGHYADYVAKWGHLDNDFEIYAPTTGEKIDGDYSNNVFSISAEYGRKKDIGNDWYFEPQIQAQLARVTGAEYTTSQGTKVSVDGINSLIGRAGFRLGKDFGEEKQSTVYIKADVLHEFLGDQDIRALDATTNGNWSKISYENEGTWYDVGLGFAAQMSKNSYAFLDLERSFGHDNDETYQINVGMQWSF